MPATPKKDDVESSNYNTSLTQTNLPQTPISQKAQKQTAPMEENKKPVSRPEDSSPGSPVFGDQAQGPCLGIAAFNAAMPGFSRT